MRTSRCSPLDEAFLRTQIKNIMTSSFHGWKHYSSPSSWEILFLVYDLTLCLLLRFLEHNVGELFTYCVGIWDVLGEYILGPMSYFLLKVAPLDGVLKQRTCLIMRTRCQNLCLVFQHVPQIIYESEACRCTRTTQNEHTFWGYLMPQGLYDKESSIWVGYFLQHIWYSDEVKVLIG